MTPQRLAEIRERAERATAGPWETFTYDNFGCSVCTPNNEKEFSGVDQMTNRVQLLSNQDADFIAHARQDIPDLLKYIGELQEALTAIFIAIEKEAKLIGGSGE